MMNETMLNPIMCDCPLCDKRHYVDRRTRTAVALIKGERVEYQEEYYVCGNTEDGENEFVPGKVMDENLLAARDAYRAAHNMFTSKDIVELRGRYGLTQRELAKLLGWGEATVSRYESKQIQDVTYDDVLHLVSEDALEAKRYLERNRDSFEESRYRRLGAYFDRLVGETSEEYLTRRLLECKYTEFRDEPDLTGGAELDIDKVCNMTAFFASHCVGLLKVKLMKLLWYTDALYYREYGRSMSGLVYRHIPSGALPVGHYELMNLVPYEEILDEKESSSYRMLPKEQFDETSFADTELGVLSEVNRKLGSFSGKELAERIHREPAYIQTAEYAFIPYSLSSKTTL